MCLWSVCVSSRLILGINARMWVWCLDSLSLHGHTHKHYTLCHLLNKWTELASRHVFCVFASWCHPCRVLDLPTRLADLWQSRYLSDLVIGWVCSAVTDWKANFMWKEEVEEEEEGPREGPTHCVDSWTHKNVCVYCVRVVACECACTHGVSQEPKQCSVSVSRPAVAARGGKWLKGDRKDFDSLKR